nr:Pycsar system effector family protein [uncultured Allomuricauda sp.]
MEITDIQKKAEAQVRSHFEKSGDNTLVFHNYQKTISMVKSAREILEAQETKLESAEEICLALWFLHTGLTADYKHPQPDSLRFASSFLKEQKLPPTKQEAVLRLIQFGDTNTSAWNIEEYIMNDAITAYVGTKQFSVLSELFREETNSKLQKNNTLEDWREQMEHYLRFEHKFYTDYARENWEKRKRKNLKNLIKAKKKWVKKKRKEKLKQKLKATNPDRGVQTLFRVALRNHIKLSDIADTKANILLSVNAIIISLALSNLIPKLDNPSNTYLIYPTLIFVVFSVISMILSIVATQPNVTKGEFDKKDVKKKAVNLIFFGNFHRMSLKDYEWAIFEMLKDQDYIYSNLIKDLYFLGNVLERKYRILRWNYIVFMIGIVVSVIAFFVAFKIGGTDRLL